jgi:uncharacterized protein YidB (DUF937 family)
MSLVDVLNGMQNGPRGQRTPAGAPGTTSGGTSGGMSPITMALLGLLAFKAIKSLTGGQLATASAKPGASPGASPGSLPGASPGGAATAGGGGGSGGLGDLLKGGLGGLLAGGAAGSVLSGGLNDLLKQFQQSGQGDVAQSWIGRGPNQAISPDNLADALGADRINTLSRLSGMSRDDLLNGLSQQLPDVVDQLTPDGRVPTEEEASRIV